MYAQSRDSIVSLDFSEALDLKHWQRTSKCTSQETRGVWKQTISEMANWIGRACLSSYTEFGESIAYCNFTELQENVNAHNFIELTKQVFEIFASPILQYKIIP